MSIAVDCVCGRRLLAPDQFAGTRAPCPTCGRTLEIPPVAVAARGRTHWTAAFLGGMTVVGLTLIGAGIYAGFTGAAYPLPITLLCVGAICALAAGIPWRILRNIEVSKRPFSDWWVSSAEAPRES